MGCPKVTYHDGLKKNSWLRYISYRIFRRNENFMCGVTGQTGSGKTYCGLSIAEMLRDEYGCKFDIDYCVFSFLELMELINRPDLKRGSVILFDEPQVELGSKNHQSEVNKVFYMLTSTFRHLGFILLFCNPFLEDLDKSTRKLFHANFQVISKDSNTMTAKIKPLHLEWSSSKNDWYRNFLRVVHRPEGKSKMISQKLKTWTIPHPSKELAQAYEVKKREFTSALNKKILDRLKALEQGNKPPSLNPIDKLTDKQREAIEVTMECDTQLEAAKRLGMSSPALSQHLTAAEKKGVTPRNYTKLQEKYSD